MFEAIDWIVNFFKDLWEIICSAFNFLVSIITGTLQLLTMIPNVVSMITQAIGYLPAIVTAFATASLSVLIVYIILGRSRS